MDVRKGGVTARVEVPGLAEPKNALQGLLEGTEITVEDVRSAVAARSATAKGQSNVVVGKRGQVAVQP